MFLSSVSVIFSIFFYFSIFSVCLFAISHQQLPRTCSISLFLVFLTSLLQFLVFFFWNAILLVCGVLWNARLPRGRSCNFLDEGSTYQTRQLLMADWLGGAAPSGARCFVCTYLFHLLPMLFSASKHYLMQKTHRVNSWNKQAKIVYIPLFFCPPKPIGLFKYITRTGHLNIITITGHFL